MDKASLADILSSDDSESNSAKEKLDPTLRVSIKDKPKIPNDSSSESNSTESSSSEEDKIAKDPRPYLKKIYEALYSNRNKSRGKSAASLPVYYNVSNYPLGNVKPKRLPVEKFYLPKGNSANSFHLFYAAEFLTLCLLFVVI